MQPMDDADDPVFILRWDYLNLDEMQERIDWLRENLTAGEDWGFSSERKICVLKNTASSFLYRMRWFEQGKQTLFDES